ncbi:MAG: SUMF1/EgtB/PvdO family nonheme iron enzyme [Geminicoccaceae bacterium]
MRNVLAFFLASLSFAAIWPAHPSHAQERIALVMGNSSYQYAETLPNPSNDAVAMGDALEGVGFDVTVGIDLDQRGMQEALRDFGLKAETADVALVYFAGHGIQVANSNYLLPIDAQLKRERDLIYEAAPLGIVMAEVSQARKLGIVILDACRNNPLADNLRQSLGPVRSKLVGAGMARVEDVPTDTLIAFSTRFNQLAYDGVSDLSPFTEALVKHIPEPGLELNLFFRKVRDTVLDLTADRQEPRTLDALGANPFYFTEPKSNKPPVIGVPSTLVVTEGTDAVDTDIDVPTDPDNDELSIEVMGLPAFGAIEDVEGPLNFGDQLSVSQLRDLKYRPVEGKVGSAGAFLFVVRDGQGGVTAGRLPINVIRSNDAPTVAAVRDLIWPTIPLGIDAPTDPDGDAMSVTVLAVPMLGEIKDGDKVVVAGDSLSIEALSALVLDPNGGAAGEFAYEVTDDQGAASRSSVRLRPIDGTGVAVATLDQPGNQAAAAPEAADEKTRNGTPSQIAVPTPPPGSTAPSPSPAPSTDVQVALLETTTASNIRNGPDTTAEWLMQVPGGTQLKLIKKEQSVNWYEVETLDGRNGYISGSLVRPVDEALTSDPATVTPTVKPQSQPVAQPEIEVATVDSARLSTDPVFRECDLCPTMVALPEGRFRMGSETGDRAEQPVREVSIGKPFAIGKFEITVAEWQACAAAGACRKVGEPEAGDETRPMRNISWPDAATFVEWLATTTGQPYRLPSEAEWEYAARAGEPTQFWWGDDYELGRANCAECEDENWDRKSPAAIGLFEANPFGLHDMNGGVSEWVADCWAGNYQGAPADGSARAGNACPQRVLRGGSWRSDLDDITATSRFNYDAQVRYYTNGFRVARDLAN